MLFPTLRIGYMVLPEQLFDAFRIVHARNLREPSYIVQKALADFIRDGHASSHIRKMRREYQTRRDILVNLLNTELRDNVRLDGLDTGMHLIAYLPNNMDDQLIAEKALERGVVVVPLSRYYHSNNGESCTPALILGFGDADQKIIPRVGRIVTDIINKAIASVT